jgi:hypothetical protein
MSRSGEDHGSFALRGEDLGDCGEELIERRRLLKNPAVNELEQRWWRSFAGPRLTGAIEHHLGGPSVRGFGAVQT